MATFAISSGKLCLTHADGGSSTTAKNEALINHLSVSIPPMHSHYKAKTYLLTCNFVPDSATLDEAWKLVEPRLERVIRKLKEQNNTLYVVSAIEMHDNRRPAKEKEKRIAKEANNTSLKYVFEISISDLEKKGRLRTFFENDENLKPNPTQSLEVAIERATQCFQKLEVSRVFSERNGKLERDSNQSTPVITQRVIEYIIDRPHLLPDDSDFIRELKEEKHILSPDPRIWKIAYESLKVPGYLNPNISRSLLGYPHLHMAICVRNQLEEGEIEKTKAFLEKLMYGIFTDVWCTRKKDSFLAAGYTQDAGIIAYILKYHCHGAVHIELGHEPVKLHNISGGSHINNFYYTLTQRPFNIHISNVLIPDQLATINSSPITKTFRQHINGEPGGPFKTPPEDLTVRKTMEYMIQNELAMSIDSMVYKFEKESIFTYTFFSSKDKFFKALVNEGILTLKDKAMYKMVVSIDDYQYYLPIVHIEYDIIEFGTGINSFFMHIASGIFTRDKPSRPAHHYYPGATFDQLESIINNKLKPDGWLSCISKYRGMYNKQKKRFTKTGNKLFRKIYTTLMPKNADNKNTLFHCKNMIARMTVMGVLERILPKEKTSEIDIQHGIANIAGVRWVIPFLGADNIGSQLNSVKSMIEYNIPNNIKASSDTRVIMAITNPDQVYQDFTNKKQWGVVQTHFEIFSLVETVEECERRVKKDLRKLAIKIKETDDDDDIENEEIGDAKVLEEMIHKEAPLILLYVAMVYHKQRIGQTKDFDGDTSIFNKWGVTSRQLNVTFTDEKYERQEVCDNFELESSGSCEDDPTFIDEYKERIPPPSPLRIELEPEPTPVQKTKSQPSPIIGPDQIEEGNSFQTTYYRSHPPPSSSEEYPIPNLVRRRSIKPKEVDIKETPKSVNNNGIALVSIPIPISISVRVPQASMTPLLLSSPPTPKLKPIINIGLFKPIVVDPTIRPVLNIIPDVKGIVIKVGIKKPG